MSYNESFQWFLDGVLTYRDERDDDDFPETWLERKLAALAAVDDDENWKVYLRLSMQLAELLDGGKVQLLGEVGDSFRQILYLEAELPVAA